MVWQDNITLDLAALEAFCTKWHITELALFGSVLRDDFGPDSDIDFLVTFAEGAPIGLFEHVRAQRELSQIVGRTIDLVNKAGIKRGRNPRRIASILTSCEVLIAA